MDNAYAPKFTCILTDLPNFKNHASFFNFLKRSGRWIVFIPDVTGIIHVYYIRGFMHIHINAFRNNRCSQQTGCNQGVHHLGYVRVESDVQEYVIAFFFQGYFRIESRTINIISISITRFSTCLKHVTLCIVGKLRSLISVQSKKAMLLYRNIRTLDKDIVIESVVATKRICNSGNFGRVR